MKATRSASLGPQQRPLTGNRLKSEFLSGSLFPAINLACLALFLFGCGNKEPVGLSMDELKTQNRAPLEIVSFRSIGGEAVLDILFDDTREAESPEAPAVELVARQYELTVTNISNRPLTSFHCTITYEDANGQVVTSEDATTEIAWAPAVQLQTIDPGETVQIQMLLTAPKNTVAKCSFSAIAYQPDKTDVPPLFQSQISDRTWKPYEGE